MEKINVKDLRLAELRCFEDNNIKLRNPFGYGILLKIKNNDYVNVLNVMEKYPIFERKQVISLSPKGNFQVENLGNYNGNTLKLLTNEDNLKNGPCWLIDEESFDSLGEQVTFEEIENYVLDSDLFFKDRMDIAQDRLSRFKKPFKMLGIIEKDRRELSALKHYFKKYDDSNKVKRK